MTTVNQLLQIKGYDVWSVAPDTTTFDAIKLMADMNVGSLLVIDNGEIAGIVSERDYARKIALHHRSSKTTPVKDIMTTPVVTVRPDQNLQKCMTLMTDKRIRHLPVVDENGELMGIISIGDVVKAVISEQEVIINHLQDYIAGVS